MSYILKSQFVTSSLVSQNAIPGKGITMKELVQQQFIEQRIFIIRGHKVMLDKDLAQLYGVKTKVLNQATKRNIDRFPEDFMFKLTKSEKEQVVTVCDHLKDLKFSPQLPCAFTEQGVAMLSSVLRSKCAIRVNIAIMRTFVRLKQVLSTHKELAQNLGELERRIDKHDKHIIAIFEIIKELMKPLPLPPPPKPKGRIGFHTH